MVFTSDPHKTYLSVRLQSLSMTELQQPNTESFVSVGKTKFQFNQIGVYLVVVDACTGNVNQNISFAKEKMDALENHLKNKVMGSSIVILASRGELGNIDGVAEALVSLGTAKQAYLQNNGTMAFLGFSGKYKPPWTKLFTGSSEQGLGPLEKYIPLQLEEYGCRGVDTVKRKDLELLKQALKTH